MAREHLRAFGGLPGVELAGLHSRTPAKAEALAGEFKLPHLSASVRDLYERSQAGLVVMAVPERAARLVAEACFEFPWAVLMEKPPGQHADEARAIARGARERQRRAWVALNRRFLSSTEAALGDLERIEGPRFVHVTDQQSLRAAAALGHPPEIVRHWMYANSIHVIDLLRCFGRGPVTRVTRVTPWNPEAPGVVLAHVQFEHGDTGLYEGIWDGPGPWAASITTAVRRWELRPLERASFQNAGERALQAVPPDERDTAYKPGFRRQAEHAVAAVRGEASRAVPLEDAVRTMDLIESIFSP